MSTTRVLIYIAQATLILSQYQVSVIVIVIVVIVNDGVVTSDRGNGVIVRGIIGGTSLVGVVEWKKVLKKQDGDN